MKNQRGINQVRKNLYVSVCSRFFSGTDFDVGRRIHTLFKGQKHTYIMYPKNIKYTNNNRMGMKIVLGGMSNQMKIYTNI